jgi:V/A-type H+-transporting ATPase subunit A
MTAPAPATGRVARVTGPLVEVSGAAGAAMFHEVRLGSAGLPGEIVAIRDGVVTVQAYEYTGGLRPGDPVRTLGHPLAARLGPWLLGGAFDGLLRPLGPAPPWLAPGAQAVEDPRRWRFLPSVRSGEHLRPGDEIGVVSGAGSVRYRVQVPPGVAGPAAGVAAAGDYRADEVIAAVGGTALTMTTLWPVRRPRPYTERLAADEPLHTGQRIVDALFPIAKGSTAAVPGGFGTGKTVLLQQLAMWCDADVIVYVGCGERGNEMAEVVAELSKLDDPRTGGRLADRTVVIANTSNMAMMARESSVYAGVTVAEYFRDMGHDVVVIADSTSRWAEALREFGSRGGAMPAEEGYPADLASALAAFYERAGRVRTLGGAVGSVTIVGAVSPPGGDLTEPVTANTQRFVRCLWTLDRELAYARHYPAVSWAGSFSRDAPTMAAYQARHGDPGWPRRRIAALAALAEADRVAALAELIGVGALPGPERAVLLTGRLLRVAVLQQSSLSADDGFCGPEKSAALLDGVLDVGRRCRQLIDEGVPADTLEALDFGPLARARDEVGPQDAAGVTARCAEVLARLDALSPRSAGTEQR